MTAIKEESPRSAPPPPVVPRMLSAKVMIA
jgi:hypothetical protein